MPLNIVMLCSPARVGGLERVVQTLAPELVALGHRVTVVAVAARSSDAVPFLAPFANTGVSSVTREFGARDFVRERRGIQELFMKLTPDVVHTHGFRCDLLHGGPARRAGIATVSTVHGASRMEALWRLYEWLQVRALRRFDAVIAVSAPLYRSLRNGGVRDERLHLVPNAVARRPVAQTLAEARGELALPVDGTPVIGWVGRLVQVKGADTFLDALAMLPRNRWLASIIGDGSERAALEAQATRLGIADRVRFHGEVEDAARLLPAFSAFVLSSRSEGTPMVVLEAMQAGVPVVATAVGGVPDLVGAADAAWLVPSDSPAALSAAITELLADPEQAARRGEAGRARIDAEHDSRRWAERHEFVYAQAVSRRRAT